MRLIPVILAAVLAAAPALAQDEALVTKPSPHDVATTLDRIAEAVEANGGKVFYRIDHAAAAEEYGKEMPPAQVLIFGNPANGTGLMKQHPAVSVDLPLKVGAYDDGEGNVTLIYRDPVQVMAAHGLEQQAEGIAGMLQKLTDKAVAEE